MIRASIDKKLKQAEDGVMRCVRNSRKSLDNADTESGLYWAQKAKSWATQIEYYTLIAKREEPN